MSVNPHLQCNCGGYDSHHNPRCPRYGHDTVCEACRKREQTGFDGPCRACAHERASRPTPPIVGPNAVNVATDRLVLKLNVTTTMAGKEYVKLTEDQLDVMIEELEKTMRKHLNYAARSAEFAYGHLGMTFKVGREI